jgi:hypothetical protein
MRTTPRATQYWVLLEILPLLVAAGAILLVRIGLGFRFPVPWPDEVGFVAPAFDLARTGSFFDPGMNPDRVVMWMPPGYMVLLAGVFRVVGYSFAAARWVSTLCCLAALGVTASLIWRLTSGWPRVVASWAMGLAFLSPIMLACANVARMEMLLALMIVLALAGIVAGRPFVAAALIAAAGTVHFNAIYFVLPLALALGTASWRRTLRLPRALDWAALAAAALVLAAYGVHVQQNWPGFQADMAFQFGLKRLVSQNDPWHPLWWVLAGVALTAAALAWQRRADGAAACATFGLAFVVMTHNGHELWYDYGQALGFALIALALLAPAPSPNPWPRIPRAIQMMGPAAALLAACLVPLTLARSGTTRALGPVPAALAHNLVAPGEIAKVRRFIATLKPGETVNFGWNGMELFFLDDLARAGAHWTIIRHSVTEVWPLRPYDWRVRCDSSLWPAYMFAYDIDYPRQGKDTGCDIIRGPGSKKS